MKIISIYLFKRRFDNFVSNTYYLILKVLSVELQTIDPHPFFPSEAWRKFVFESLTISCARGCRTHAGLDFGRRVEQSWPWYFLRRRLPHTRRTGLRLARRTEVALLFLVREAAAHTPDWTSAGAWRRGGLTISCAGGCRTHARLDLGRREEQRWPYYFSCRKATADAEAGGGRRQD